MKLESGNWKLGVLSVCLMFTVGCASTPEPSTEALKAYREAVAVTAPGSIPLLLPGAVEEQAALKRFEDFYLTYSADSIRAGVRDLYAEDAYFGDPFKSVSGIDAIEAYFLKMAEPVESCTFSIDGVNGNGGEYFFWWTMDLVSKAAKNKPVTALGMSHVRFNPDGKVVFQQDYWDSSSLLDRLPVVGYFTRAVKRRLE